MLAPLDGLTEGHAPVDTAGMADVAAERPASDARLRCRRSATTSDAF